MGAVEMGVVGVSRGMRLISARPSRPSLLTLAPPSDDTPAPTGVDERRCAQRAPCSCTLAAHLGVRSSSHRCAHRLPWYARRTYPTTCRTIIIIAKVTWLATRIPRKFRRDGRTRIKNVPVHDAFPYMLVEDAPWNTDTRRIKRMSSSTYSNT